VNAAYSRGGRRGLWAFYLLLLLFLYAPILILIVFSFNAREFVSFPWEGFTFRWYHEFLANKVLLGALRTSAFVATLTAFVTLALAIPASIAMVRRRYFAKGFVTGLIMTPLVIPLIVFALSLQILLKVVGDVIGVEPSKYTVVIGHAVIALPFAVLTIVPRLERINVSLEEASRDLGAGALLTFRNITLPLLFPALISAFVICFTISFDEIVIASFIAGEDTTFPLYLYSQLRLPQSLPQVIAVAVVVMVISGVVIFASEILRRLADRSLEHELAIPDEVMLDIEAPSGAVT
jgi:spermidine/putrescine transport system permease protein